MERLDRRDWTLIAICAVIVAISALVTLHWFTRAFPEASIEFRFDRAGSRRLAEGVLRREGIDVRDMRNGATFDADDSAKIFLERTLGLDRASALLKRDVHLWYWQQRWFRPLQEEEYGVLIAPTGELVGFHHTIPEDRAIATPPLQQSRTLAEAFLRRNGIAPDGLQLVSESERNLPHRRQRIFTWDSRTVRPGGAPYRHTVVVDGNVIGNYSQGVRVPDEWQRTYAELRSKNQLAGGIDVVFLGITMIAALVTFVVRLRRGDLPVRFLVAIGIVCVVLVTGVSLNSFPSAVASYDTTASYPAFIAQFVIFAILQSVATAMLLIVICGSGEVLYREYLPGQLAIPRLWTARALGSKRVFRSFVLAYTLVAFFLAYQVVFYIVAGRFGAWAPADIPYDNILNTAFPWIAVLFAGFFPALSEEFLSRAFSIPFFERILRSRIFAIVVAGFIWGFGHATYPNQPFYIRGVEVGLAGVLLGFLLRSFGLLPLLIWHFTVDAFYTSILLFRSHNTYYIVSGALAAFVFAVPMLVSIVLYIKRRGFLPDDELTNATMPTLPEPEPPPVRAAVELPPGRPLTARRAWTAVAAAALAAALLSLAPASINDAVDYRISKERAKEIAAAHLRRLIPGPSTASPASRVIAGPSEGFRSWERESAREDGGSPGGFDRVAAEHMLASGLTVDRLVDVFRTKVHAATWTVRFFTPMKKVEYFIEIDPRTSRVVGYHKLQDENAPGPALSEADALTIARRGFATYGLDASRYEMKEALSFQQPRRRDWLFHFDERAPLVDDALRRTSVRVAGSEVSQFATTVKLPESVYRAANRQTIRSVVLVILKIAGGVTLLSLVVGGFIAAAGRHRPRWRRALRWAIALSIVPIASAAAGYEPMLFSYGTSVQWQTFFAGLSVTIAGEIAMRTGLIFLAVAAIDAVYPYALDLFRREGRARFGRSAIVAGITAIAVFAVVRVVMQFLARLFPGAATVSFDVPSLVAAPYPGVLSILEAVYTAVAASGAVAAFAAGLAMLPRKPWLPPLVTIATLFCAALDTSATFEQTPLMLGRALLLALLAWIVARFILDGNLFAWPAAFFLALALQDIAVLAQNGSRDLQSNAVVAAIAVLLVAGWVIAPRETHAGSPAPEG